MESGERLREKKIEIHVLPANETPRSTHRFTSQILVENSLC